MTRPASCEFCPATDALGFFADHWMCQVCQHLSLPTEPLEPSSSLPLAARRFSGGGDGSLAPLDGSMGDLDRTAARARAIGIGVAAGELTSRFPCVLPGHDHDARLHPGAKGFWLYTCHRGTESFELAEIRAFQAYGESRTMSVAERVCWRELMDFEAGFSPRRPARIPLPPRCSPSTREVGKAWRLHVGLRNPEVFPADVPFIFARQYVMARAYVSDSEARSGVEELEKFGSMVRVGLHAKTRAILWRPGPSLLLTLGCDDSVIEEVKRQFDATEEGSDVARDADAAGEDEAT